MVANTLEAPDWARLYQTYWRYAVSRAARVLHDESEAEDLAQELFVRLLDHPELFAGRENFSAFFDRVMVHRAINAIRGRTRRKRLQPRARDVPTPEQETLWREAARALELALTGVTEQHREMFRQRELEGLTYADIAARAQVAEGTVKSGLHRARLQLKRRLAPYWEEASGEPRATPRPSPRRTGLPCPETGD